MPASLPEKRFIAAELFCIMHPFAAADESYFDKIIYHASGKKIPVVHAALSNCAYDTSFNVNADIFSYSARASSPSVNSVPP
ncbi:MAG: hypothetical protein Pg6C_13670 [Treponemataceae bacterium]|nr:MAG: hypothetical protein Pg6C_13670 [Treponemataceae bacterium]